MNGQRAALLSSYQKDGELVTFARDLEQLDYAILASGGTAAFLRQAGLAVTDLAQIVGSGPLGGHAVVTLYPHVHLALQLARTVENEALLASYGVPRIDLLYVGLYPLASILRDPGSPISTIRDNIDVGGPAMLMSGVKGHFETSDIPENERRVILCDPGDLTLNSKFLRQDRPDSYRHTCWLAAKTVAWVEHFYSPLGEALTHHFKTLRPVGAAG